jgi:hypothetical protein
VAKIHDATIKERVSHPENRVSATENRASTVENRDSAPEASSPALEGSVEPVYKGPIQEYKSG